METAQYESEIAALLANLSAVQEELLALLGEKRACLATGDMMGLKTAQERADHLIERLAACQEQRKALLVQAGKEGLPNDNVRSLASAVVEENSDELNASFAEAQHRTRLLQHHSLTNWVIVQRSLIHLSQMIEILATGGRMRPTYDMENSACESGGLVDRAV
ncbi:MAG: flagellar export chaperone FlgN [Pirellulales bacterium]|nr:flagellar export chaperone FlgN [Pirellulales bacterium]